MVPRAGMRPGRTRPDRPLRPPRGRLRVPRAGVRPDHGRPGLPRRARQVRPPRGRPAMLRAGLRPTGIKCTGTLLSKARRCLPAEEAIQTRSGERGKVSKTKRQPISETSNGGAQEGEPKRKPSKPAAEKVQKAPKTKRRPSSETSNGGAQERRAQEEAVQTRSGESGGSGDGSGTPAVGSGAQESFKVADLFGTNVEEEGNEVDGQEGEGDEDEDEQRASEAGGSGSDGDLEGGDYRD